MLDDPAPGAPMDGGLKLAVTPLGNPEALKATAELKRPITVVLIELGLLCPSARLTGDEAASVKFGCGSTFSATLVDCGPVADAPVIVKL
jgi:hypothetical protein